MFGEIAFAQLFFQGFIERSGIGEGNLFGLLSFAAVVFLLFVIGYIIFGEIIAQRNFVNIAAV